MMKHLSGLGGFEALREVFARLCSTEDAKEGVRAFMEKRSPTWKEKQGVFTDQPNKMQTGAG